MSLDYLNSITEKGGRVTPCYKTLSVTDEVKDIVDFTQGGGGLFYQLLGGERGLCPDGTEVTTTTTGTSETNSVTVHGTKDGKEFTQEIHCLRC